MLGGHGSASAVGIGSLVMEGSHPHRRLVLGVDDLLCPRINGVWCGVSGRGVGSCLGSLR